MPRSREKCLIPISWYALSKRWASERIGGVLPADLRACGYRSTSKAAIAVLGNCQNTNLVACIQALTGDVNPASYEISLENVAKLTEEQLSALVVDHDFLFAQNSIADFIITQYPEASGKIVRVPHVTFNGYHPDLVYIGVRNCDEPLTGPTWHYHSSIALYSWLHGFNVSETLKLYTNETYERLGFFDYWKAAEQALLQEGDACGLPLDGLLAEWATRGCFMHSYNHPKLFATADVARALLQKIGLPTLSIAAEEYIVDMFQERGWVWPVYPEIGNRHRVKGNYVFRTPTFVCPPGKSVLTYGLKEYVEQSFAEYAKFSRGDLICSRLEWPQYRELQPPTTGHTAGKKAAPNEEKRPQRSRAPGHGRQNPYTNLPDHQFWRRAVADVSPVALDPVVEPGFAVDRSMRVATAGSCFAQYISQTLRGRGFNYYEAEMSPEGLSDKETAERGYGIFSARYGNLYTARQLIQLFDRAYGDFTPSDRAWTRNEGGFVDPFRPQIEPGGFATIEDLEMSRTSHLAAVRRMFESLDVFVFTLGLTEGWRAKADGAVFPLAPGVAGGEMDFNRYEFVNFDVADVIADLGSFLTRLSSVNRLAQVILTVSPVPLIATYEKRHVLVSTTYSKSVLRAAAEVATRQFSNCHYFPAYEIITGNYNRGRYFEDDLRSVTAEGVDHVMKLFVKHYCAAPADDDLIHAVTREIQQVAGIFCDEERLAGN